MIVDTHVHLIRAFDAQGNAQAYSPGNPTSAEDYAALMEASGVGRAFFISWSPEDIPSDLAGKGIAPDSVRQTMSRDYALEVMARFPDRFYWFPCHLGPGVGDCLGMARRNLELGAAGLKLACSFWGELPDDERLLPVYGLAEAHEAGIIIDTSFWYLGKDEPTPPERLPAGHREVAARISGFRDYLDHLRKVIAAFPRVNFQLAHAGARTFTPEHATEVGEFMRGYPHVFADLGALPLESAALECLAETAGADRLMFGTDWPHFGQGAAMRSAIEQIPRPGRFTAEEAAMILGENALRFVRGRGPGLRGASAS